jgi:hypothetical protein
MDFHSFEGNYNIARFQRSFGLCQVPGSVKLSFPSTRNKKKPNSLQTRVTERFLTISRNLHHFKEIKLVFFKVLIESLQDESDEVREYACNYLSSLISKNVSFLYLLI